MALEKRYSISTVVIKFLWILFLVFQECNLVICDGLEDDSLKRALEAIERRQRDLEFQENDYFGQPENIGYGFQKTLGFFDNSGPASDLGSFDSDPKSEGDIQNILLPFDDADFDATVVDKRKTNFRERMTATGKNHNDRYLVSQRDPEEDESASGVEYLQLLKNLWAKHRQSRPDDFNVEDLTDDQVEDILSALYDKEYEDDGSYDPVPVRSRKNYRVFDTFEGRSKRYPSFGEGFYGKRNQIAYRSGPENEFLYSLKYVNPELNREAVESLTDGSEFLGDERDTDVASVVTGRRRQEDDGGYDEEGWLPGPVDWFGRNEKRELTPRLFKQHNGIRLPVKRSSVRVRKAAEKTSKEVKNIFAETTTTAPSKKMTKKVAEAPKKNVTKPEVTKHHEGKKLVRRSNKYTKEEVSSNSEIADLFGGERRKSKKSIDWSQYFGLDKRSGWLRNDHLRRTEQHLMEPKKKRFDDMPFDTRRFSRKRFSTNIDSNIDRVEDKIGDIEERIIDDAVKYTGAHSGGERENLGQVKSKVMQRLEAAYSLEKMKNALEEFKNLIKPVDNSDMTKTSTEAPKAEERTTVAKESSNLEKPLSEKKAAGETTKRFAPRKETAKGIFGQEPSDSAEFLGDVYSPDREPYDSEGCLLMSRILQNCARVEEVGGRFAEQLSPLCSVHQMCYFCPEIGFFKVATCDAVYLREARNVCQGNGNCLVNARKILVALQDLYKQSLFRGNGRRLPSYFCLANPCVGTYVNNSPGAMYLVDSNK